MNKQVEELKIQGIGVSEGIQIGMAFLYQKHELKPSSREFYGYDKEIKLFNDATELAVKQLDNLINKNKGVINEKNLAIFESHKMMVQDPSLQEKVSESIKSGLTAEEALNKAIKEIAESLRQLDDAIISERANDVEDIGRRILRNLLGVSEQEQLTFTSEVILVAEDLAPSDTVTLPLNYVKAIITQKGGYTSHTAILARTLGIPAVVGIGEAKNKITNNDELIVDGETGLVIINPTLEEKNTYKSQIKAHNERSEKLKDLSLKDCYTKDNIRIHVLSNIANVSSAKSSLNFGSEGIGLLRSEFMFINETSIPDESHQIQSLIEIFSEYPKMEIVVRLLDIGGDKHPNYLHFPEELNPFLGIRAVRLYRRYPDLLKTQLRAILQASIGFNVKIMIPMVASIADIQFVKQYIQQVQSDLEKENLAFNKNLPLGIMIETPASVFIVDLLANHSDFFSIGTNDLTQYVLTVDRTNENLSYLFNSFHPAVLKAIQVTINAGESNNIPVAMCGALAGVKKAVPLLLGMGLKEFSMVPNLIPEIKSIISQLDMETAIKIKDKVMALESAEEVEKLLDIELKRLAN